MEKPDRGNDLRLESIAVQNALRHHAAKVIQAALEKRGINAPFFVSLIQPVERVRPGVVAEDAEKMQAEAPG